jgi:MioC protein
VELTILVGTMTGNAQLVAEEVQQALGAVPGCAVRICPMDALRADALAGGGCFLICTSTYGQGDLPDNARAFFASLASERPDLSDVFYGLIALGDQTYSSTFCMGGRRFDALLSELGAQRVGEPLLHDACGGELPEEAATAWAPQWLAALRAALEAA